MRSLSPVLTTPPDVGNIIITTIFQMKKQLREVRGLAKVTKLVRILLLSGLFQPRKREISREENREGGIARESEHQEDGGCQEAYFWLQ